MNLEVCPVCRNEMSIGGAFKRYITDDVSDVEVSQMERDLCEDHWDMLMDAMKKYDEDVGIDVLLEDDPTVDF